MSPEDRAELARRFKVRPEDVEFLLSTSARPKRRMARGVAIVLVLTAGVAVASVQSRLVAFLARVSDPDTGEMVPRQIPYRGYLERDGVPVSTQQTLSFRLEYGDGGTAWTEPSLSVPVSNGHFEVALGDNPANQIPPLVFADPSVSLAVSIGGAPLVGKQRLLTVPYSARALDAWRAVDAVRSQEVDRVLVGATTINVGAGQQFTTLQDAWTWLKGRVVRGTVVIDLADGTHSVPAGFALNHPDGASIRIIGNVANPGNVILNAPDGIRVNGSVLALIDGVHVSGGPTALVGINVYYGGNLTIGANFAIDGYSYPIQVEGHAMAYMMGGTVTCNSGGVGINSSFGSYVQADGVAVSGCQNGFQAISSGALLCSNCSASGASAGWVAQYGSFVAAYGSTGSTPFFYATDLSVVLVGNLPMSPPAPVPSFNPGNNLQGNYGAFVRH